jgi:hypothetical protein
MAVAYMHQFPGLRFFERLTDFFCDFVLVAARECVARLGFGSLPSPAARTPRRRVRGTSKWYARQHNHKVDGRGTSGPRRAGDRAGNIRAAVWATIHAP